MNANTALDTTQDSNGTNWISRVFYVLMALSAGTVFVQFLLNPQPEAAINFDRELAILKTFSKLDEIPQGTLIFDIAYFISASTGCLACLLAIILCLASGIQKKSRNLAASLSMGCLALAYLSFVRPFYIESIDLLIKMLDVFSSGLLGMSLWYWVLFIYEFPQKESVENYIKEADGKIYGKNFSFIPKIWQAKAKKMDIWYINLIGGAKKRKSLQIKWAKRVFKFFLSYKGLFTLVLFYALSGIFNQFDMRNNFVADKLYLPFIMISIFALLLSYEKIVAVYLLVDEQSRKQITWIYLGLLYILILLHIIWLGWIFLILFGFFELGGILMMAQFTVAAPLLWFIFILTLMISIFYHGSIDPRLVIKKSAVYGFMGVVLTTLFVAIEGSLQTHAILQFGLHDQTGAIVTGTVAAVLFGPVRNKMEVKVEGFIDRILPVSALAEGKRRTSAIVFNDISGYTAISEKDEDAAFMLVSIIHQVGTKAALESRGRVVKTIGDAIMLELPTVEDALNAAKTLHEKYTQLSTQYKLPTLPIHTGIHWGEVVRANDGDIYGKNVNLAARLEGVAGPSEIVMSQEAYDQIAIDDEFKSLGGIELKNILDPVECYSCSTATIKKIKEFNL